MDEKPIRSVSINPERKSMTDVRFEHVKGTGVYNHKELGLILLVLGDIKNVWHVLS